MARYDDLRLGPADEAASIETRMATYNVTGAAIAIADGGEIVHEAGHGVRRAGSTDAVTSRTLFQACSISKPIVALAMLRLVDRGVLDLDADVNDVLTSWRVPANGDWQPRVTLRQIASHSAGLTTPSFPGYPPEGPIPTLQQILLGQSPANTAGVRVDIVPGVQFRYAGGGTTVMHQLLEDVTGRPLSDLMRELVLDPLGMADSHYVQPLPEPLRDRAACAHLEDGSAVPGDWHVYPELAAAGLWTTPGDLLRYARGVQRAVAGEADALLSPALAAEMLSPHVDSGRAGLTAVGLGPFVGGAGRSRRFGHSGGNYGYTCELVAYAEEGRGAAIMTNSDAGRGLCWEALDAVAAACGWDDWTPLSVDWPWPDEAAMDRRSGRYRMPGGAEVDVRRAGFWLDVTMPGQPTIRCRELDGADGRTYLTWSGNVEFVFTEDGDHPATLTIRQSEHDTVCERLA